MKRFSSNPLKHGRWLAGHRFPRHPTQRWLINTLVLGIGDGLALSAALLLSGSFHFFLNGSAMFPDWYWFVLLIWWIAAVTVRLLPGWGLGAVEQLRGTVLLLLGVYVASTSALFLANRSDDANRMTLTLSLLFSLPLVPYLRTKTKLLLIRLGLWGMPTVVFGDRDSARHALEALQREPGLGYEPVAVLSATNDIPETQIEGIPVVQMHTGVVIGADTAIMALQGISRHEVLEILDGPLSAYRKVVVIPDLEEAPSLWVKPRDLGGILGLEITQNLQRFWPRAVKRVTETVMVALTLPIWLPAIAVIAVVVWLPEKKSPFYAQERIGLRGRTFRMWKFRTMVEGAETVLNGILERDTELREEWQQGFKLKSDPRVTPVGEYLRRYSLDELPQLFHVLDGSMSLVGPRPLPDYHRERLPPRVRFLRETVRPGISGLWQVNSREMTGPSSFTRWDTYYIRNWSIWLDMVILVRTLRAARSGQEVI